MIIVNNYNHRFLNGNDCLPAVAYSEGWDELASLDELAAGITSDVEEELCDGSTSDVEEAEDADDSEPASSAGKLDELSL